MVMATASSSWSSSEVDVAEWEALRYHRGFGNEFESDAVGGTLPTRGNTPQQCAHGTYAEQLSGTAFTVTRHETLRTWMYKTVPSVTKGHIIPLDEEAVTLRRLPRLQASFAADAPGMQVDARPMRWLPENLLPYDDDGTDATNATNWIQGLRCLGGAGAPQLKTGMGIYTYNANVSMHPREAFRNCDGTLLFVPEHGDLYIATEMGRMWVPQGHIAVIPRGIVFRILCAGPIRGYVTEIYEGNFQLPELGPIGTNGLSNPTDFETPVATFDPIGAVVPPTAAAAATAGAAPPKHDDDDGCFEILTKFGAKYFLSSSPFSPFNVIAWRGNYAPYRYDLAKYCPVGAISFDHLDPSIYTVLTCPSARPGVAVCDFVIFPPRWNVTEDTFRPPYYHRNVMTEYMGLIRGIYDAKEGGGFVPGGSSLHSIMIPHGPDAHTYDKASTQTPLAPTRSGDDSLAFMFETTYMLNLTDYAENAALVDADYPQCWVGLKPTFDPSMAAGV